MTQRISKNYIRILPSRPDITAGKFTGVSLFSGVLGLDLGLHAAGFSTKVCVDIDKDAYDVSKTNFPDLPYLREGVENLTAKRLRVEGGIKGEVDMLMGGPPCQPFSKSGLRQGMVDLRGRVVSHYIRLLQELRPRAFLFENVRGLFSSNGGKDFQALLSEFRPTGYTIYWSNLDAANYGVPQFRQRLFLVGFRNSIYFEFPQATHGGPDSLASSNGLRPFVTVEDAIGDLQGKVEGVSYRSKYAHLLPDIPEGLNYSYYCAERGHLRPVFGWRSKFWYFLLKIDRKKPSLTIQAHPGNNTGPFHWENRKLDVRELKRLQTIPDWLRIHSSYLVAHRLIGNAVPPLLAYKLGIAVRHALQKNRVISLKSHLQIIEDHVNGASCMSGRGSGRGKKKSISKGLIVTGLQGLLPKSPGQNI